MEKQKTTSGPWRFEINEKSKTIKLCGGRPRYDLTVMDFTRWGMFGAIPRLRADAGNLSIMARISEYAKPEPFRTHHAEWHKIIDHPDALLIEEAPAMKLALDMIAAGVARIEGYEFCFDGIRYGISGEWSNGTWTTLMNCIGWDKATRSLTTPAKGE